MDFLIAELLCRIAATTICLGLRRPRDFNRVTNATIALLSISGGGLVQRTRDAETITPGGFQTGVTWIMLVPVIILNSSTAQAHSPKGRKRLTVSGTRLPPRVFDREALLGPRMKDSGPGEKVIRQLRDPSPGRAVLLTAPPERAAPEVDDPKTERAE